MASSFVFVIQICLIQYALSQPTNTPTMTNIYQVGTNARNAQLEGLLPILEPGPVIETAKKLPVVSDLLNILEPGPVIPTSTKNWGTPKTARTPTTEARNAQSEGLLEPGPVIESSTKVPVVSTQLPILEPGPVIPTSKNCAMAKTVMPKTASTEARNAQLEGLLPILEPGPVIEIAKKIPGVSNILNILDPGPVIPTSTKNWGTPKTAMPRTPTTEARNAQLEGIFEPGPLIETSTKVPVLSTQLPILEPGPVIPTSKNLGMPKTAMTRTSSTEARNAQLEGILEPGPVIDTAKKIPVVSDLLNILEPGPVTPSSTRNLLRTPSTEARNIQLGGQITTQGSDLVKDTVAKVPGVPKTPINPYKPLLENNNDFMNPSMANIGLGIGVSRQAMNAARNIQVKGQLPVLEPGPVMETSTKVPIVPNQHNTYGSHIVPTSNDFMLTNLGISKTVIPRKSTNGARNIQVEGQIATQASEVVKDTLAKVPGVPKTPINPYKPLMANNNAFMNPSMANIGLGIGVSRQASNGAGMLMPSQKFNGAEMPKMARSQWSGTGAVARVSDELPIMWQNFRKMSRNNDW